MNRWLRVILWAAALWIVFYLGALLYAAPKVRNVAPQSGVMVSLGPLPLVQIDKIASGQTEDYTLVFTLQGGTVVLGCICVALEVFMLIGIPTLYRWRYHRRVVHNSKK